MEKFTTLEGVAAPLKIVKGTGSPIRAMALVAKG